jgi:AcrR family transcriptional regulator
MKMGIVCYGSVVEIDDHHISLLTLTSIRSYILVGMFVPKRPKTKRRLRDPEHTRKLLPEGASREVHKSGFQRAGLDTILAATEVIKGALYNPFNSKEALGYAIVEEVIAASTRQKWLRPLRGSVPINALICVAENDLCSTFRCS